MTELYEALGEMKMTNGSSVNGMYSNMDASPRAAIPAKRYPDMPKRKSFKRTNTETIMATEYPPVCWVVPDYLPEGFNVLAGRQKLGKTWLAIDWSVSVASGQYAMGAIQCEKGDVLYIDLENGDRRIQRRINTLYPDKKTRPDLSRLEWVSEAPPLDQGFIDCLEDWRLSVKSPRLVVIDVLQRIKPIGSASRNAYENDYSIYAELQSWATTNGIAVLGLHHTRKGGADDPLEALTGSNGLSAVADATLVLDRNGEGVSLYVRGRDVEEKDTALSFSGGIWSVQGDACEVRRSNERSRILITLQEADELMSPNVIADVIGMKRDNVRQLLHSMSKAGEVQKSGRGKYYHPDNQHLLPVSNTPNHIDHNDHKGEEGQ